MIDVVDNKCGLDGYLVSKLGKDSAELELGGERVRWYAML
jgi:hypothetical protein